MIPAKVSIGIFAVIALILSYLLHYALPRYMVAEVSGADSKRAESLTLRTPEGSPKGNDIYFIYVVRQDGSAGIFRNEDTAWGPPPYFKFNAADLQAEALRMKDQKVLIKYYGWRNKYLKLFPNVLYLAPAADDSAPASWTRRIIFTLWILLLIVVFPRYYAFMHPRKRQLITQG